MKPIKIYFKLAFITSSVLVGCIHNKIETEQTLSKSDKKYIQSLHLLEPGEKIIQFYSEYNNQVAGNFFTEKRLAKYWIDQHDTTRNELSFAYYNEVKSIDTVYNAGLTYCPYMLVTKDDLSKFKVCVEGNSIEVKKFFEGALEEWTKTKATR